MKNERILITGGAGSIGSELAKQLNKENQVFILDINETELFNLIESEKMNGVVGDVRDKEVLEEIFARFQPAYVFHCAALKHVTPSAWTPKIYIDTNIGGTINVLELAKKYGVKMINISTDKVVNPESIMGATKKVAELAVKNDKEVSVRFGNVLGSRGSLLEIWNRQMKEGKPLTVTDSRMERYFMEIPDACELLIEAAEVGEGGQILIMDMGEPVNILELAKEIITKKKYGLEPEIIGARPGEKLSEDLMTTTEKELAVKKDKFYIIN
ncbi:polysaccharide biosynthesis protein [Candidatus Dojkabacteria bacterium]|jgi:FlaA1/EpsC-like NDP-sugar epimerase|nr:polysaccharide biosynthesis protein [Candidatus Dojkabacteria bacterium]